MHLPSARLLPGPFYTKLHTSHDNTLVQKLPPPHLPEELLLGFHLVLLAVARQALAIYAVLDFESVFRFINLHVTMLGHHTSLPADMVSW
jgi:hypothetical protein